ncbi:MAG: biopolymer transporter ExbB [Alphaproteobacteria bacterium]|nr:MAG: biopolymer transporter ExbB [Alphaproteobacteria bacterium]
MPLAVMLIVLALVTTGAALVLPRVEKVFLANLFLNGVIFGVFVVGVIACFWQVGQVWAAVRQVELIRRGERQPADARGLVASLGSLPDRIGAGAFISATSARAVLDSIASRIEEGRDVTRYLANLLIFLGLLGTFYGLATTVPAVVDTIRALRPTEDGGGVEIFAQLMAGLESQLGGMGTAFSSSLLGLAGSLVVGLLEIFAAQSQNNFYRDLEDWLARRSRVGFAGAEEGAAGGDFTPVAEALYGLQLSIERMLDRIGAVAEVSRKLDESAAAMNRLAEGVGAMARRADTEQTVLATRLDEIGKALSELAARIAEREAGGDRVSEALSQRLGAIEAALGSIGQRLESEGPLVAELHRIAELMELPDDEDAAAVRRELHQIRQSLERLIAETERTRAGFDQSLQESTRQLAHVLRGGRRAPAPAQDAGPSGKARRL